MQACQTCQSLRSRLHNIDIGWRLSVLLSNRRGSPTELLDPEIAEETGGDAGEDAGEPELPVAGGGLHLGEGLAEGGAVQGLLLRNGHLLPVALLLLAEGLERKGKGSGALI